MIENLFFRAWVANTVHAISGIWSHDWRGLQRKRPLTVEEIRMAACQVGIDGDFESPFRASMRDSRLGATNKRLLH